MATDLAGGHVDRRAYLFALAPVGVVLAVAPALAAVPRAGLGVALGSLRLVGPPLALAGLCLAAWSVHSFAQAGEPPSPADEPGQLVIAGALAPAAIRCISGLCSPPRGPASHSMPCSSWAMPLSCGLSLTC